MQPAEILLKIRSFPQGYFKTKQCECPLTDTFSRRHSATNSTITDEKQGGEGKREKNALGK